MVDIPDSSGLPSTGSLNQLRQHFTDAQLSIIASVYRRNLNKELQPIRKTLDDICQQLAKDDTRRQQQDTETANKIAAVQRSVEEWSAFTKSLESSARLYEEQIHQHVASVDQKAEDMAAVKAVAYGCWDIAWDIVARVKASAKWMLKRCEHFEAIAPKGRGEESEKDYKNIGHLFPEKSKNRRWRERD